MNYEMRLNPKYFNYIKNGTKRIEIRLNDEKRKNLKVGDQITFLKESELYKQIKARVVHLTIKRSFKELVDSFDISQYADASETKEKFLNDLYSFYTKEQERTYGVIGIEIELKEE